MTSTILETETPRTDAGFDNRDQWIRTGYFAPDFEDRVNRELDRLAALEPNWDGEGAPRIDPGIIQAAREFISRLPKHLISIPAVVPSAAGNLQFEWNAGERSLELEIEAPSVIHYLKWDPREKVEEEDVFDIRNIDRAVFLIHWFTRGTTYV